jgi:hypothetical protein
MAAVESMARFTALYADEVILTDKFDELHDHIDTQYKDVFCMDLAIQVHVLLYLEPIIENGLITFARVAHRSLCTSCYAKALGESGGQYLQN